MQITNIIFDVGNVLFSYNPKKIINKLTPDSSYKSLYLDALFSSHYWQQLDEGTIRKEDVIHEISNTHNLSHNQKQELNHLIDNFIYELDLIHATKDIFEQLQKRYKIFILSNFQSPQFDRLAREYPFLNSADGKIISAEVKLAKPNPAIYKCLLSTYKLNAEECLFIDDLAANISAAKKQGIHGIIFQNESQLLNELQKLTLL
ncbi:hypothetical protein DID75_00945 [Candidatus Marinamargulisbacteria bacterium SCGC AG-410-N11]|nr:hypothetical protein DID75_00945 [Candidatus Marinamargulisbacteria bacterium SCGC AG-410-N11]